ncbi:MAG: hypothetical protein DRM97_05075 [Thermoprotei archaeon]|nr:MAG: hypothetical protein DRM97_05075 [Thermoprotei archaeon]
MSNPIEGLVKKVWNTLANSSPGRIQYANVVIRSKELRELEALRLDLDEKLNYTIGRLGVTSLCHGGYRIEVNSPMGFPWRDVIIMLIANGYKVTVERINDRYVLEAQLHVRR